MKTLNVSKNKMKTLLIPVAIIVIGIVMFFVNNGFNFDIEFQGGVKMEIAMDNVNTEEIKGYLEAETGINPVIVQTTSKGISIKTQPIDEELKAQIFQKMQEKYQALHLQALENVFRQRQCYLHLLQCYVY